MHMNSLATRLLLAASLVIAVFLGVTGWALSQAVQEARLQAIRDALGAHLYTLMVGLESDGRGQAVMQAPPLNPEFSRVGSGLIARVSLADGTDVWRSASALGLELPVGPAQQAPGETAYRYWRDGLGQQWMLAGIPLLLDDEAPPVRLEVARATSGARAEIDGFKRRLWAWLGVLAVGLLAVQWSLLRWSLLPLRSLRQEVGRIEHGDKSEFTAPHPVEFEPLVDSLNGLLRTGRAQQRRYENALGELAHSLKTPLAVLQATLGTEGKNGVSQQQLQRMNDIVRYQLSKARTQGMRAGQLRVPVCAVLEEITAALLKVYSATGVSIQFDCTDVGYRIDRGDLMEILGNTIDNACKWARSEVHIGLQSLPSGMRVCIEDDGPGIGAEDARRVLQRGARADESRDGQGIGLAVVHELMQGYAGTLAIARSETLGGARIDLNFP